MKTISLALALSLLPATALAEVDWCKDYNEPTSNLFKRRPQNKQEAAKWVSHTLGYEKCVQQINAAMQEMVNNWELVRKRYDFESSLAIDIANKWLKGKSI